MPSSLFFDRFPTPNDSYLGPVEPSLPCPAPLSLPCPAPLSPTPCPPTPTPLDAVLPNYATLVKEHEVLLAALSTTSAIATKALVEVTIAQDELDDELARIRDLMDLIAEIAGPDFANALHARAKAAAVGIGRRSTGLASDRGGNPSREYTAPASGNPSRKNSAATSYGPASYGVGSPSLASASYGPESDRPATYGDESTGPSYWPARHGPVIYRPKPFYPFLSERQPPQEWERSFSLSPVSPSHSSSSTSSSDFQSETTRIHLPTMPATSTYPIIHPPPNSLKRRHDDGSWNSSSSEPEESQKPPGRTPSGASNNALIPYSSSNTSRRDSGRQERVIKRVCIEVTLKAETPEFEGFADKVDAETLEREGEGEESDDDDSSYVTSGSDVGSGFSSTTGSSFLSDDDDDDDWDKGNEEDARDDEDGRNEDEDSINTDSGAGSPFVHPTGRPAVPVRYTRRVLPNPNTKEDSSLARDRSSDSSAFTVSGLENGGSHTLAVDRADETQRRAQKLRNMLAANAARYAVVDDGEDEDEEEGEGEEAEEEEDNDEGDGEDEGEDEEDELDDEEDWSAPTPSTHLQASAYQSQPEAGPSRTRRPLTREGTVIVNPDGTTPLGRTTARQPQPHSQPGPSAPRSRPLTRDRERVRETLPGIPEVYIPEEEPIAQMPHEGTTLEENHGVPTFPYAADLRAIKAKAGWESR